MLGQQGFAYGEEQEVPVWSLGLHQTSWRCWPATAAPQSEDGHPRRREAARGSAGTGRQLEHRPAKPPHSPRALIHCIKALPSRGSPRHFSPVVLTDEVGKSGF